MFFVAERAADIAQVRVMRIDLYDGGGLRFVASRAVNPLVFK